MAEGPWIYEGEYLINLVKRKIYIMYSETLF